jgi:PAS domain S-box-containing protein
MKKQQAPPADGAELRRCAEERLKIQRTENRGQRTELETARLVYELQVHQIELEMQNEELRRARARADALLAQYTDLYDFVPGGYLTLDREGTIRQLNLTGARLLGIDLSRLLNRRFGLLVAEDDRRAFSDFLQKVFTSQTKECCEVRLPQAGHHALFVRIEGARSANGQECLAAVVDLTERREAETRFRVLFEQSPDGIVIIDPDTARFLEFNEAAHRQLGYSREEFARLAIPDLEAAETPEETWTRIARVIRGGKDDFDTRQRTRQGEIRDVHVTAQIVEVLGRPVYHCVWRDITEKKKLEAQSLRHQRIESVGRLTSGIAHDLNNILAPILMCAPLLRETLRDPAGLKIVDLVEASAQRGAGIIKQLLTFGRGTAGERVAVQLLSLVRDMANIIGETFPKNITARREAPSDVWPVSGDATQLHQVLMNLCVNARDAMPEGGTLTLELENVQVDEALARMNPGASPGRYVVLSVTDTGAGIPPENLDKVFDPFFTTKELGEGTGLGLSTVIGIVKSHRGSVAINSKVGRGTQFRVYLPAGEAPPDAGLPLNPEPLPRGQGELVLIVDDEESLRRVARQILERHGYRALEAADGTEGLTQYAQRQAEIQLVMTDLAMPFMDGPALIRALRQTNPQARIVAMSGHQSVSKIPKRLTEPVQAFLAKPFNSASLLQTVWRVLHPETSGQSDATKSSP